MQLCELNLTQREQDEIERLLGHNSLCALTVEKLWEMMDRVWDELGCDNRNPTDPKISAFYEHPIWVLNGLFIEKDQVSMMHREAISDWTIQHKVTDILDYGGGFGTLARLVATKNTAVHVDIYEPFPSELAVEKAKEFSNIQFTDSLARQYQCLICLDVLEHVPDPLTLLAQMTEALQIEGYLIIANCFYPYIKCHLPSTFHFRYTFNWFARAMGLKMISQCEGSHAIIYQKVNAKPPNWKLIQQLEQFSRFTFLVNEFLSFNLRTAKWVVQSLLGKQGAKALKQYLKGTT